ncbi:MAG: cation:proton antiporter, partial [Pseudomonadota bacterium]
DTKEIMIEFNPTATELLFWNALALIVVSCVLAPLFVRLRLGSILGYLAAGLLVQLFYPGALTEHPEELLHFAEFGVVLFLFVIGLELHPSELWRMRRDIFGLGTSQMLACGVLLAGLTLLAAPMLGAPLSVGAALLVGLGLALSSTALVMQNLDERGDRQTTYGRVSFSVLLFQDLAIVPLLLLVTLLAPTGGELDWRSNLVAVGQGLLAIALLILIGRFGLNRMFVALARSGVRELMTAAALGVVIGAALLLDLVGLSYAMGAFIAGVLLSESAFRHEVEANVEPFRALFLALFFVAVGMSLELEAVLEHGIFIVLLTPLAMALKAGMLYALARLFGLEHNDAVRFSLALPQQGEFGFVLFAAAAAAGVLVGPWPTVLIAVVTVSMALSPLLTRLEPLLLKQAAAPEMPENYEDAEGTVLIIGFGRFGQIVSQPLFAMGYELRILDASAERVQDAERFGFRVHYGDGTRRDVLQAAGAAQVDLIVVAVDDPELADDIVRLLAAKFPQAKRYVRAFDRRHALALRRAGIDCAVRETFESALWMGEQVLVGLGNERTVAQQTIEAVRVRDRERLEEQFEGDLGSGLDRLHVQPVRPEPLLPPDSATGIDAGPGADPVPGH